jgi:hypothetical protein
MIQEFSEALQQYFNHDAVVMARQTFLATINNYPCLLALVIWMISILIYMYPTSDRA